MAKQEIQPHGGSLTRPAKGQTMNPNGRPRKYVSILKDAGYKLSEINDTIQNLMAMRVEELNDVYKNPDTTILEKTIAGAMIKSMKNGSLYSLDTLLTRVYGKPKETTSVTNDGKIEFIITKGKTIL
jgi:hypothetical protein